MPVKDPTSISKWHNASKFRQRGIFRPTRENPLIGLLLALPKAPTPALASPRKTPRGRKSTAARKDKTTSDAEASGVEHGRSTITKVSSQKRALASSSPTKTAGLTAPRKSRISAPVNEAEGGKGLASQPKGATGKRRIVPESSEDEGQPSKPAPLAKTELKRRTSPRKRAMSETDDRDDSDNVPLQMPAVKRRRLSPIAESPVPSAVVKVIPARPSTSKRKRKMVNEAEDEDEADKPTSPIKKVPKTAHPKIVKAQPSEAPALVAAASESADKLKKQQTAGSSARVSKADLLLKRWGLFETEDEDEDDTPVDFASKKDNVTTVAKTGQQKNSMTSLKGKEKAAGPADAGIEDSDFHSDAAGDLSKKQSAKKTAKRRVTDAPKKADTELGDDDVKDVKDDDDGPKLKPNPKLKAVRSQKKPVTTKGEKIATHEDVQKADVVRNDFKGDAADDLGDPPRKQTAKKAAKKAATVKSVAGAKNKAEAEATVDGDNVEEPTPDDVEPKPKRGRIQSTVKGGRKRAAPKPKPKPKKAKVEELNEESEQEEPGPSRKKAAQKRKKAPATDNDENGGENDKTFADITVAVKTAPARSKKKPPSTSRGSSKPKPKSRPPPPRKSMFARALAAQLDPDSEADPLDLLS
ncbi:hypothetical protein FRB93_007839 [Tulasnella sp. JGI-2019a]|nr:hypothetical protein FRB93_007839 [Tulasnella sp. JGI-2019a]